MTNDPAHNEIYFLVGPFAWSLLYRSTSLIFQRAPLPAQGHSTRGKSYSFRHFREHRSYITLCKRPPWHSAGEISKTIRDVSLPSFNRSYSWRIINLSQPIKFNLANLVGRFAILSYNKANNTEQSSVRIVSLSASLADCLLTDSTLPG